MPPMESAFIVSRKHDDICGRGVPALKSVGVACVNTRRDMSSYVSTAASTSSLWMPTATRMSMCCGRSAILSSVLSRYERSSVLNPK